MVWRHVSPPPPPPPRPTTLREETMIAALRCIVLETMQYPPLKPYSTESYLPEKMVEQAQEALALYGQRIEPKQQGPA